MIGTIIWLAVALIFIIFFGYFILIYNSFVRLKNNIEKAWANIDVLLKQRHDELNNLINTVKGYMQYEKETLLKITQARTSFMNAKSISQKAQADNVMHSALKSLFAVSENYPQLKANENFLNLQKRISELENQIADRREFYNDSVNIYNIRLEQIPYVFIGKMLSYTRKELFKIDEYERNNVEMKFD